MNEKLGLNLGLAASYLHDDAADESWLHNTELSAGIDFAAMENVTVSALALYSIPLSDDAEDIAGLDNEFTAGVTVALAF